MSKAHPRGPRGKRGARGKPLTKFQKGEFCAWDGEGLTVDARHRYVLLANSRGVSQWETRADKGLSTIECLDVLTAGMAALDRRTIHVIFGGSYDVNCWVRDLTPYQLEQLYKGRWVTVRDLSWRPLYKIQYRPRRSFAVHSLDPSKPPTKGTVWDVWGFFQGTFVGALEKYGLPVPKHLARMKRRRSQFEAKDRNAIVRYCADECDLLERLMGLVREHLETAQLPIKRWDGAGACAAALLTRESTNASQSVTPPEVRRATQHAYAGGRIELLQFGHMPRTPIHHYDVVSAYPAALLNVPALNDGEWIHYPPRASLGGAGNAFYMDGGPPDAFTLFKIRWSFTRSHARLYPFFWRAPDGSVYYPRYGSSWVWRPEYEAALAALRRGDLQGEVNVSEAWSFRPRDPSARPFAFVQTLFEQRRQWKDQGIGAEKMLKLSLNSLYGKCAQHVGAQSKKIGEELVMTPPRFHQLEWAGWITSETRARLFTAACEAGKGALMLATDGIFSLAPIPSLEVAPTLGAWEYKQHTGCTIVQSGVYWLDDRKLSDHARLHGRAAHTETSAFCRGFDRGSLDRARIVRAWAKGASSWAAHLTRFVTMGAVVSGHTPRRDWRQWRTMPRQLALYPTGTKRSLPMGGARPDRGATPTIAAVPAALLVSDSWLSAPYPLPWVAESEGAAYSQVIDEPEHQRAITLAEWDAQENDA